MRLLMMKFGRPCGHRWLYFSFKPTRELPPVLYGPMPPPSCTANDIHLFVQLNHENGQPLIAFPIQGDLLEELLTRGEVTYAFEETEFRGNGRWCGLWKGDLAGDGRDEQEEFLLGFELGELGYFELVIGSISVHLIRNDDGDLSMRSVFCYEGCGTRAIPKASSHHFELAFGSESRGVYNPDYGYPLQETPSAMKMSSKLSCPVLLEASCNVSIAEGRRPMVSSLKIRAVQYDFKTGLVVQHPFVEENGVTLLHIFSEIA